MKKGEKGACVAISLSSFESLSGTMLSVWYSGIWVEAAATAERLRRGTRKAQVSECDEQC